MPLTKDEIMQIVQLELEVVKGRIEQRGYKVNISPAVKEFLVDVGYDKKFGARPLKRAMTTYLENTFAQAVLRGDIKEGASITFSYREKDKKVFIQNRKTDAKDKAE